MSIEQGEYNPGSYIEKNYEGNQSELLVNRLHASEIKKQLCDLMYELGRYWTEDGKEKDGNGEETWPIDEFAPSYEDIETQFNAQLENIEAVTDISYDKSPHHNSNEMHPYAINPLTGSRFTTKELSIIEAHEKGHLIRLYEGPQYDEYFQQGFNLDAITVNKKDIAAAKKHLAEFGEYGEGDSNNPDDINESMARQAVLRYLFSGNEIAERMNQLKNYFGFKANEAFTREHLSIARKNYIPDTGMDNGMSYFFQAILPETEDKFLELINHSGI